MWCLSGHRAKIGCKVTTFFRDTQVFLDFSLKKRYFPPPRKALYSDNKTASARPSPSQVYRNIIAGLSRVARSSQGEQRGCLTSLLCAATGYAPIGRGKKKKVIVRLNAEYSSRHRCCLPLVRPGDRTSFTPECRVLLPPPYLDVHRTSLHPPPTKREAGEWQSIPKHFSYTQRDCLT